MPGIYQKLQQYFRKRNREIERQNLTFELETIYQTRRYLATRESMLIQKMQKIDLGALHDGMHIRKSRGW